MDPAVADDISLVCDDFKSLTAAVALRDNTYMQWDLTSAKKTEVLVADRYGELQSPSIVIRGENLEGVSQFKYLGSSSTYDSTIDAELAHWAVAASGTFARLHKTKVWTSKDLSLPVKLRFLQSVEMSVLSSGGAEICTLLLKHLGPLSVFNTRWLRL